MQNYSSDMTDRGGVRERDVRNGVGDKLGYGDEFENVFMYNYVQHFKRKILVKSKFYSLSSYLV